MNFDLEKSIELLERTPQVYKVLLSNLKSDWGIINEGSGTWSAFDIIGHLIHGENTDWIPRAELILSSKEIPTFEPFDRFAQKGISKDKTLDQLLDEFEVLRKQNLIKLKSWDLKNEELDKKGKHPDLGAVTLRQLISTWTIHDIGHLNQLSRVMIKHYKEDVGSWGEYSKILRVE